MITIEPVFFCSSITGARVYLDFNEPPTWHHGIIITARAAPLSSHRACSRLAPPQLLQRPPPHHTSCKPTAASGPGVAIAAISVADGSKRLFRNSRVQQELHTQHTMVMRLICTALFSLDEPPPPTPPSACPNRIKETAEDLQVKISQYCENSCRCLTLVSSFKSDSSKNEKTLTALEKVRILSTLCMHARQSCPCYGQAPDIHTLVDAYHLLPFPYTAACCSCLPFPSARMPLVTTLLHATSNVIIILFIF